MVLPQYELRISYDNGSMLNYLKGVTASGLLLPDLLAAVGVNLLSPSGLPLTLAAATAFLTRQKRALLSPALQFFSYLALIALIVTAAVWPWHPWAIQTKWSLWLQCLSAIAIIHFASLTMDHFRSGITTPLLLTVTLVLGLRTGLYRSVENLDIAATQAFLEAIRPAAWQRVGRLRRVSHFPTTLRIWTLCRKLPLSQFISAPLLASSGAPHYSPN